MGKGQFLRATTFFLAGDSSELLICNFKLGPKYKLLSSYHIVSQLIDPVFFFMLLIKPSRMVLAIGTRTGCLRFLYTFNCDGVHSFYISDVRSKHVHLYDVLASGEVLPSIRSLVQYNLS